MTFVLRAEQLKRRLIQNVKDLSARAKHLIEEEHAAFQAQLGKEDEMRDGSVGTWHGAGQKPPCRG